MCHFLATNHGAKIMKNQQFFAIFAFMNPILKIDKPSDYAEWVGSQSSHPLVAVIRYDSEKPVRYSLNSYNVYGIFYNHKGVEGLTYGIGKYESADNALVCVAPGQIGGIPDDGKLHSLSGWVLLFHPSLLHGTQLGREIHRFSFFDYQVNESLHLTEEENEIIVHLMKDIARETSQPADDLQNTIIVGYIAVLLRYCQRFYYRQFSTESADNSHLLAKLEKYVKDYFNSGMQKKLGLPSIQFIADKLCISPNYLGDVVKRATGETAGYHLRNFIARRAKELLSNGMSISETAYYLGFDYPQHFTRMFKRQTGMTPSAFIRERL